jgi:hypothetical protein
MTEPSASSFRLERTQFQVFENFERTGSFHERTSKELMVYGRFLSPSSSMF